MIKNFKRQVKFLKTYMNPKLAIIAKNFSNANEANDLQKYGCTVLHNTIFDKNNDTTESQYESFCVENSLDALVFVNPDEEVKHIDMSVNFPYICVTDGEWIIKPRKIYRKDKKFSCEGVPCIFKSKNLIKGPKIDDSFINLKNIYTSKNYKEFVVESEKWFFHNSVNYSKNVMLRYYMAVACFLKTKNTKQGMIQLCQALLSHPQYSELWCLWADFMVENKRYYDAFHIYDIAIITGKNRNIYDENPVWLKKYDAYPKEMKNKIVTLLDEIKVMEIKKSNPVHSQSPLLDLRILP